MRKTKHPACLVERWSGAVTDDLREHVEGQGRGRGAGKGVEEGEL